MTASPDVLLFDVLDTLVYDPFYVDMPAFFGMTLRELIEVKHPTAWVDFELGQLDEREMLDGFFADRRSYDQAGLRRCMQNSYRFLDGIEPLLRELQLAGHRPQLLSNYPIWYRWIEDKLKLSRYADWSLVSCDLGLRKPDPEAFTAACEKLGVDPAQCLFVDDRASNCKAADGVGMSAHQFEGAATLRTALVEHGFLPR